MNIGGAPMSPPLMAYASLCSIVSNKNHPNIWTNSSKPSSLAFISVKSLVSMNQCPRLLPTIHLVVIVIIFLLFIGVYDDTALVAGSF